MKNILKFAGVLTASLVSADNLTFLKYSCNECQQNGGMLCQDDTNHHSSVCCDPNFEETDVNSPCYKASDNLYCASASTPNQAMWDFACKANSEKCPSSSRFIDFTLEEKDTPTRRKIKWFEPVPSEDSAEWNCKYWIQTKAGQDVSITDHSDSGFIRFTTVTEGFNETIWLLVQPYGEFVDSKSSKIYNVSYGEIFYIPAEYQVLVSISPTEFYDNATSQFSQFLLDTQWVNEPDADLTKLSYVYVLNRPDSFEGELTDNYDIQTQKEVKDEVDAVIDINDTSFLDTEVFEFQGITYTVEDVAKVSVTLIVIIIVGVVICMAVSWYKRRAIAKVAQESGEAIRRFSQRVSTNIRQSFSKKKTTNSQPNQSSLSTPKESDIDIELEKQESKIQKVKSTKSNQNNEEDKDITGLPKIQSQ